MIRPQDLLCPKPEGLYCAPGDFYIDPVRPVARAVITHGHSDHARAGHGAVLATPETLDIMAERYGLAFAEAKSVPISSPSGGKRNTGRPKVASLMNTSQGTGSNGGQVGSRRRL